LFALSHYLGNGHAYDIDDALPTMTETAQAFETDSMAIHKGIAGLIKCGLLRAEGGHKQRRLFLNRHPKPDELRQLLLAPLGNTHDTVNTFLSTYTLGQKSQWAGLDEFAQSLHLPTSTSTASKRSKAKLVKDALMHTPVPLLEDIAKQGQTLVFRVNPHVDFKQLAKDIDRLNNSPAVLLNAGLYKRSVWQLPVLYNGLVGQKPMVRLSKTPDNGKPGVYYLSYGLVNNESRSDSQGDTQTGLILLKALVNPSNHAQANSEANTVVDSKAYALSGLDLVKSMLPDLPWNTLTKHRRVSLNQTAVDQMVKQAPMLRALGVDVVLTPDQTPDTDQQAKPNGLGQRDQMAV
jgi:hypothetical protein